LQQDGTPVRDEDTAAGRAHPLEVRVGDSSRAAVTFRVVDPETDYGKEGPSLPEQRLRGSGSGGPLRRRR
jgi:hypothetical protein